MSADPDRALIHECSLLFNLLFILGRNPVLSTDPSIGIIFHSGSWLRGLVSWWHRLRSRQTLPMHEELIYEYETTLVPRDQAQPLETTGMQLAASQVWTADFKCFNFMHAFHYIAMAGSFSRQASNRTILHRLLKSTFVFCQHKHFNLMLSLLSKHWVCFKLLVRENTALCSDTRCWISISFAYCEILQTDLPALCQFFTIYCLQQKEHGRSN